MIAKYERAQILERSRRGKRHRAQLGEVSVMSNAPYGYRYLRKTDEAPAAYIIDESEARVVRRVYEMYTVEGLSIGEITRRLNTERIATRKASRWERSVVWALLRNPAYRGLACFGKTRVCARTRVMRPQRRRGVTTPSTTAGHERAREEWIEIPVPALVTEESFARAQELLYHNKIRSRRRTIAASVVQGLVSCAKCGYAFSRTSTQTSARKIHYYKCIGSDSWRKLGGPVCDNGGLIRQELLDQIVWAEVIRLLEDPTLIQQELDRRLVAARAADPTRKREQSLQRELTHIGKGVERLLNAYQEGLLSIEQLCERMPVLRQRQQALSAELQAIADQTNDRAGFLPWQKPSRHFLSACAALQRRLASLNVRKSCACWLKTFWSAKIRLRFATAFRFPRAHLKTKERALQTAEITFCVRGVISPMLSNVYPNEVDRMLEKAIITTRGGAYTNVQYARFADDLVVLIDAH